MCKIFKNSDFIILIIIYFSFLLINSNIVYFGDDYYFVQYKNYNFIEFFRNLFLFYFTDNGRFIIHLLITLFLKMPIFFWQLFNSLMLTSICFFISKLTCNDGKNKIIILLISFFLLSSIEIKVTRQSLYWLTGSFNYVYPCIMIMIYAYFITKINNKKNYTFAIFFGLLSSASMEQSAVITVCLTTLLILSKFSMHKKINQIIKENKKLFELLAITIIGACSVLFSPAQFNRLQLETQTISLIEQILENIRLIITFYTQSKTIFYFIIVILVSILIYIFQNEEHLTIKKIMIILITFEMLLSYKLCFLYNNIKYLKYLFLILLTICLLYCNKKIYYKLISPLSISFILIIVCQGMMIISPVLGYRNFIFGLVILLYIIGCIVGHIKLNSYLSSVISILLLIIALIFNYNTAKGYFQTKQIHRNNIIQIQKNQNLINQNNAVITLQKYKNEDYAWSMPYNSPFHLKFYKKMYGINSEIEWK